MIEVLIYSRSGCHLCDVAEAKLNELRAILDFKVEKQLIDGDLAVTTDFRDVYSTVIENVLQTPAEKVLGTWNGRVKAFKSA